MFFSGYLADVLKMKKILSMTHIRKLFTSISFIVQGSSLIIVAYLLDPTWCVVFVTISVASGAFSLSGFMVNPLDISPQFASIVLGTSNTFSVRFKRKELINLFLHDLLFLDGSWYCVSNFDRIHCTFRGATIGKLPYFIISGSPLYCI